MEQGNWKNEEKKVWWLPNPLGGISPKVTVCQTLKEKIKSAIEGSSWRVAKQFCGAVVISPKVTKLEDAEDQSKKGDGTD